MNYNDLIKIIEDAGIELIIKDFNPKSLGCLEYNKETQKFTIVISTKKFQEIVMVKLYNFYNSFEGDIVEASLSNPNSVFRISAESIPLRIW